MAHHPCVSARHANKQINWKQVNIGTEKTPDSKEKHREHQMKRKNLQKHHRRNANNVITLPRQKQVRETPR